MDPHHTTPHHTLSNWNVIYLKYMEIINFDKSFYFQSVVIYKIFIFGGVEGGVHPFETSQNNRNRWEFNFPNIKLESRE